MIIVKNRELLIPLPERYLGTSYDTSSEVRQFRIPRFAQNGVDLSALTFRLDIKYPNNTIEQNTVYLQKEVTDDFIILQWDVTNSVLGHPGTMFIQLRATDLEMTIKWSSFKAAMYVEWHFNTPQNYSGSSLTEVEQMEADFDHMKQVITSLEPLVSYTDDAEAWAKGTRNGNAVASSDVTYQNNSKWYATRAEHMADSAYNYMGITEAMSFGTVDGEPVGSDDPNYHNNAKYYAEQANYHSNAAMTSSGHANDYKLAAEGWAVGQNGGADVASTDPSYHNNAKYYATQASGSAEQAAGSTTAAETFKNLAQGSATSAVSSALSSEAWAVGKRGNVDVGSSDQTYHNNAKYYAEQAAGSATTAQQSAEQAGASAGLANTYKNQAQSEASNAAGSATNSALSALDASDAALNAEAWAKGTRNGTDVGSSDDAYHNNAKYYSEQAAESAASLTVDSALSDSSTNPVQNKVITAELTDVKSAISDITGNSAIPLYAKNRYIDLSGTTVTMSDGVPQLGTETSTYSVSMMQCAEGDKFTINGVGGTQTRLWGFVSSTGVILSKANVATSATDLIITAPENAAWVITHTNNDAMSYVGVTADLRLQALDTSVDNLTVELSDIDEKFTEALEVPMPVDWVIGTIGSNNGQESASSTRIRTRDYIDYDPNMIVAIASGAKISFRAYNSSGTFLWGSVAWITSQTDTIHNLIINDGRTETNVALIRVVAAYSDDSTVTSLSDLISKVSMSQLGTLNDVRRIADAMSVNTPVYWAIGSIGTNNGVDGYSTTRIRTTNFIKYDPEMLVTIKFGVKISFRAYNSDGGFLWGSMNWIEPQTDTIHNLIVNDGRTETGVHTIRIVAAYSDDSTVISADDLGENVILSSFGKMQEVYNSIDENTMGIVICASPTGNCAIRCAKEQSYVDGTPPVIEWYLLEEPGTSKYYYSKDLTDKKYLFTFPYDGHLYSFGILENGDIIACLDPDSITTDNKSDDNRVNPYVFLASENWTICHEVDFGSNLKPCGWASNQGFKVLANGDACWCEYTRQTTYTANVWKLTGNPLDYTNWVVTKSFVVTSTDNSTLFKHCHNIMQDFYTGVCYLSTGDDNIGSMMFASTDNCDTWVQLASPDSDGQVNQYGYINGSEKYCRMAMMTFTADYIYWASDTPNESIHYLFRVERGSNGILDYATIVDLVNLPSNNGASSYGTALIPELNAIMLLERCDTRASEMLLKLVDLGDNSLITIGKLYGANNATTYIGFRCRFTEWYPVNGLIHFGFDLNVNRHNNAVNHIKGFGNTGATNDGAKNINNLAMQIYKNGDGYGFAMHTFYV